MEEKTRVETQKFREDVEKKINSFVQDEKTAKLEFPPMEKFQVGLVNSLYLTTVKNIEKTLYTGPKINLCSRFGEICS